MITAADARRLTAEVEQFRKEQAEREAEQAQRDAEAWAERCMAETDALIERSARAGKVECVCQASDVSLPVGKAAMKIMADNLEARGFKTQIAADAAPARLAIAWARGE